MQNKKVIILITLSIGAVISLIYGITAQPRIRRETSPGLETVSPGEAIPSAGRIIPTKRHAKGTDFVFWGRNPFVPKGAPGAKAAGFVLNGIMWDEKNPAAIINNDIVGIGDKIGGNTIIDIKPDKVILNDGIGNFELRLGQ